MRNSLILAVLGVAIGACGPSGTVSPDGGGGGDGGVDATPQPTCTDGQTQCAGTTQYQSCQNGQWVTTETCNAPQLCANPLGCVDCVPNGTFCVDNSVHQCSDTGTDQGETMACTGGLQCSDGECKDLCTEAANNRSYIGCEYWAVDLDNAVEVVGFPAPSDGSCSNGTSAVVDTCIMGNSHAGLCEPDGTCPSSFNCTNQAMCVLNAQKSPFAVVVSNPQSFAVDVTISSQDGTSQMVNVAAGAVEKLFPQMMGFADQSTDWTSRGLLAYKVESSAPIVAYQFNPLNNEDVFSNDGSLLIPRTTFDTEYYAMSWPTLNRRSGLNPQHDYHGYISIVAWEDDTQIQVTPRSAVKAGPTLPAITAGTPTAFTLAAFEVLTLQAPADADLTGTRIESTNAKTFGVFAGHEAIVLFSASDDATCCADHIEEMMFPTSTWGVNFALGRSKTRRSETDFVRVMAQEAGTTVTFNPAPAAGSCGTLGPGQFCEVEINGDTEIASNDKPILIGHYLASAILPSPLPPIIPSEGNGDPSMSLAVPVEQFRDDYTFLVPDEYDENHVTIVAPASVSVALDGNDVSGQLSAFGSGSHKAGRVAVNAGQHTVVCAGGCSVEVYGYSDAVSYLFAGGLDLEQIVID